MVSSALTELIERPPAPVLARIQAYRTEDITAMLTAHSITSHIAAHDAVHNTSYEQCTEDELLYIVTQHENPITRHEASFVLGQYLRERRRPHLVGLLYCVAMTEDSIVAKHEAIEALGQAMGSCAARAYDHLLRLRVFHGTANGKHPDILATIDDVLQNVERELQRTGREDIIMECRRKYHSTV